jgi:hypothetical protein
MEMSRIIRINLSEICVAFGTGIWPSVYAYPKNEQHEDGSHQQKAELLRQTTGLEFFVSCS